MTININNVKKEINVLIPLTAPSGKIRIKQRSILNEYGIPFASRQNKFNQSCYVEWQIGYDIVINDKEKLKNSTLQNINFIGANGKEKVLYELSEYIYYFYKWNIISKTELEYIKNFVEKIKDDELLDVNKDYSIERSHFIEKKLFNINFLYTQVKYPLLVHKFDKYEIITEIKITEKQRAIGIQPMLYLCFSITELQEILIGREAKQNEVGTFVINKNNISVFLEIFKIFGILSLNHKKDVLTILNTILK